MAVVLVHIRSFLRLDLVFPLRKPGLLRRRQGATGNPLIDALLLILLPLVDFIYARVAGIIDSGFRFARIGCRFGNRLRVVLDKLLELGVVLQKLLLLGRGHLRIFSQHFLAMLLDSLADCRVVLQERLPFLRCHRFQFLAKLTAFA